MAAHTPPAIGRPVILRTGAEAPPASLIYLDDAIEPGLWGRLTAYLHHRFDGQFSQIIYRHHHLMRETGDRYGSFDSELDVVLGTAVGARVLVAHSRTALAALAWTASSQRRARMLTALVLFAPVTEEVWIPGDAELHRLRMIPTWVVTDRTAGTDHQAPTAQWIQMLWADHEAISFGGHRFPSTDPVWAAEPILAALRVAHDTQLREGS
ncbi:hypothetical protein AB0M34_34285 [Nocardia sp. NPDC050193]